MGNIARQELINAVVRSPFNDLGEKLLDQTQVIRLQRLRVNCIVALAVQIIRIECTNCSEELLICCIR